MITKKQLETIKGMQLGVPYADLGARYDTVRHLLQKEIVRYDGKSFFLTKKGYHINKYLQKKD